MREPLPSVSIEHHPTVSSEQNDITEEERAWISWPRRIRVVGIMREGIGKMLWLKRRRTPSNRRQRPESLAENVGQGSSPSGRHTSFPYTSACPWGSTKKAPLPRRGQATINPRGGAEAHFDTVDWHALTGRVESGLQDNSGPGIGPFNGTRKEQTYSSFPSLYFQVEGSGEGAERNREL